MSETFCQICRVPTPGHEPWCPVLTGEPQLGRDQTDMLLRQIWMELTVISTALKRIADHYERQ